MGLSIGTIAMAYLATDVAVQGGNTPRWVQLLMAATTVTISIGANLMTTVITEETRSDGVPQLGEDAANGAHQCQ